jgi:hypothetical protein
MSNLLHCRCQTLGAGQCMNEVGGRHLNQGAIAAKADALVAFVA